MMNPTPIRVEVTYWLKPIHEPDKGTHLGYRVFRFDEDSNAIGWAHFDGSWGAGFDHADAVANIAEKISKSEWVR